MKVVERSGDAAGRVKFVLKHSKDEKRRDGHLPWNCALEMNKELASSCCCKHLSKLNLESLIVVTEIRNTLALLNYCIVSHIFSSVL